MTDADIEGLRRRAEEANTSDLWYAYAQVLNHAGRRGDALEAYANITRQFPASDPHHQLARTAYLRFGGLEERLDREQPADVQQPPHRQRIPFTIGDDGPAPQPQPRRPCFRNAGYEFMEARENRYRVRRLTADFPSIRGHDVALALGLPNDAPQRFNVCVTLSSAFEIPQEYREITIAVQNAHTNRKPYQLEVSDLGPCAHVQPA